MKKIIIVALSVVSLFFIVETGAGGKVKKVMADNLLGQEIYKKIAERITTSNGDVPQKSETQQENKKEEKGSETTKENATVENEIAKAKENFDKGTVTGEIVEEQFTYGDYLIMVEDLYLKEPSENGLRFESQIGGITIGINEKRQLVYLLPEDKSEVVIIDDPVSSFFISGDAFYYLDENSSRIRYFDMKTMEGGVLVEEEAKFPVLRNSNVYFINDENAFCVAGLV